MCLTMDAWSCCYCRKTIGSCGDHNVTKAHIRNAHNMLQYPNEIQISQKWVETHAIGVTKDIALRHIADLFAMALGYGMCSADKAGLWYLII